ncbi:MAG: DegV family protein [Nitrososphaerales archaeon]
MPNVRIVADSGCDLPATLVGQYNITLVPVFVRFGREMISSDNLSNDEFWRRAGQSAEAPGTSSPSPGTFYQVFQKLVDAGNDVVCLTLPGKHSGTYNAAWLAAQDFGEKVRVIDTGSFSLGMGLQVLVAAKEAVAGSSAELIQRTIEGLRERTSIIFVLDTLEWVRRGGRLDRIIPLIDRVARALKVKPVLEMTNGEFKLVAIARSTRSAIQRLEDEVRERLPVVDLAAAYTRGCEVASELAERIALLAGIHSMEVLTVEAGPAFAAHAGPNALGAAIIRG